jgi:hypothetical protein
MSAGPPTSVIWAPGDTRPVAADVHLERVNARDEDVIVLVRYRGQVRLSDNGAEWLPQGAPERVHGPDVEPLDATDLGAIWEAILEAAERVVARLERPPRLYDEGGQVEDESAFGDERDAERCRQLGGAQSRAPRRWRRTWMRGLFWCGRGWREF